MSTCTVGDLVDVRPVQYGQRRARRRGIVVRVDEVGVTVWTPTLGSPSDQSVQRHPSDLVRRVGDGTVTVADASRQRTWRAALADAYPRGLYAPLLALVSAALAAMTAVE